MITCPNCQSQVQNEEMQCPYCLTVLKQLYCGKCNNMLNLQYLQCVYCGQPYVLPYQTRVQESNRQDAPDVSEQQFTSQPVSQFNMQATQLRHSSKNASSKLKKQKSNIFDGDKPKGFKFMIWALKPSNGRTLTVRDNIKFILMMLGCSVLALVLLIAGFNIKDKIDNNAAANERAQRLVAAKNTNTLSAPTEQVVDSVNERNLSTSVSSTSRTVTVQDNNSSDLGAVFNLSVLELIKLFNNKAEEFSKANGTDLSAYYLPTEGWLPLHETTDKGNPFVSNFIVTPLEQISIIYEPNTGYVEYVTIKSLIDDDKSATDMELVRCSLFLSALMNTDVNQAFEWFRKGLDLQANNYRSTGSTGVIFNRNIGVNASSIGWWICAVSNQVKSTMNAYEVPL